MEIEIIKHSEISKEYLLRIIDIKNVAWPHPMESQLKWIEDNLLPNDLHIILKEGETDYAYMNLCQVNAIVDGHNKMFMGVGNVCSKTKGKGYGGTLVSLVNKYLLNNGLKGLLFCKEHVMRFYAHYGWCIVENEKVFMAKNGYNDIYLMSYNICPFDKIMYCDRFF